MKISVIIPAYNASKHIRKALDSILGQSLSDIEVIVVNDGSTDDTADIVTGYQDPRIKLVSQENGGTMAARKTGIGTFSGDYVIFCDADDTMRPDALQLLYSAAVEHHADIVKGRVKSQLVDGTEAGETFPHELPYGNDRRGTILAMWNNKLSHNLAGTLLRKEILAGELVYFNRLINGEDACLLYQFVERSTVTVLIPEVVADYFVYPDSLSHRELNEKILTDIFTANAFCYGIAEKYMEQEKPRNDRLIHAVKRSVHEYYPYGKLRRILKKTGHLASIPLSVRLECLLESLKKKVVKKPFKEVFGRQA